jgi:hypothetical protein
VNMSSKLILLLVSVALMIIAVGVVVWQNDNCQVVEYQNLSGAYSEMICKEN